MMFCRLRNRTFLTKRRLMNSNVARIHQHNDGFTLIELIISIALIAIIAVSMLTIFSVSMRMTSAAGTRSKAAYEAQGNIESELTSNNTDMSSNITLTSTDGTTNISVDGIETTENVTINDTTITIEYFQPTH